MFTNRNSTYKLGSEFELKCLIENGDTSKVIAPNGTVVSVKRNSGLKPYEHTIVINSFAVEHSGLWKCVGETEYNSGKLPLDWQYNLRRNRYKCQKG